MSFPLDSQTTLGFSLLNSDFMLTLNIAFSPSSTVTDCGKSEKSFFLTFPIVSTKSSLHLIKKFF